MSQPPDRTEEAARRSQTRDRLGQEVPEPSLAARLGQIGILGWAIVVPMLLATVLGRFLDRILATGIFFTALAIMLGAVFGLWSAWRWMHRQ